MTAEPIIKTERLTLVYDPGKTSEVKATQDVSIKIFPEEYVIFFGPSGSGKSTLLYLVAGLEKPESGEIWVDGKNLNRLDEEALINYHRNTIGFIFQAFYLIPNLSVFDNIMLPQVFLGSSKEEREKKGRDLAERFGITEHLEKKITELSGGQQQRVAAARALINNPQIILADEPVGNLDSKNAEITMELLAELNQKDKKTVVLVTHDPRYLPYADRIFYMQDGKVIREVENKAKQRGKIEERKTEASLESETREAQLILEDYLLPYGQDDQAKMVSAIAKFLAGGIKEAELLGQLSKSVREGGLGMYRNSAVKVVMKVKEIAEEIKNLSGAGANRAKSLEEFLLRDFEGHLDTPQHYRLQEIVGELLAGRLDKNAFRVMLDRPYAEGGVGLNERTAANFARKADVFLAH